MPLAPVVVVLIGLAHMSVRKAYDRLVTGYIKAWRGS